MKRKRKNKENGPGRRRKRTNRNPTLVASLGIRSNYFPNSLSPTSLPLFYFYLCWCFQFFFSFPPPDPPPPDRLALDRQNGGNWRLLRLWPLHSADEAETLEPFHTDMITNALWAHGATDILTTTGITVAMQLTWNADPQQRTSPRRIPRRKNPHLWTTR